MKINDNFLTGSIIANFLMLIILVVPAVMAYLIADVLVGYKWFGTFPIFLGLIVLCTTFPLTFKITNRIRRWGQD